MFTYTWRAGMAQITLYVDDDLANAMREAAASAGVSLSRWVADLVRARTAPTWPREFLALEGAWADGYADVDEPGATDVPRESF
jgi:hypothetical protein